MKAVTITDPTTNKSSVVRLYDDNICLQDCKLFNIRAGDNMIEFYNNNRNKYIFKRLGYYGKYKSKKDVLDSMISKNKCINLLIQKFELDENDKTIS